MTLTRGKVTLKKVSKHTCAFSLMLLLSCFGFVSCGGSAGSAPGARTVADPIRILSSSVVTGTVGQSYQFQLTASGGTVPYWWTISDGYLPLGLSLDSATGKITGVPSQTGDFTFKAVVKDAATIQQQQASQTMILSVVIPPLAITTPGLRGAVVGERYSMQMQASGGVPPYTWTVSSGALAPGLELNAFTGEISGTPAEQGDFSVVIQVADSNNPPSYASLRIGAREEGNQRAQIPIIDFPSGIPLVHRSAGAILALTTSGPGHKINSQAEN